MNTKHKLKMKYLDIKIEKANAIMKYHRLQKLTTLFRYMETIIFLVMISKFSSQLPAAVKVSGDFFRGISFTVLNPKFVFVFVIGNVIILFLYLKSRDVESSDGNAKAELCYEYVKNYDRSVANCTSVISTNEKKICRSRSENRIKVKCEGNQIHRELRRPVTEIGRSEKFGHGDGDTTAMEKNFVKDEFSSDYLCDRSVVNCTSLISFNKRKICRSRSDNRMKVKCEGNQIHRELRRSVTEIGRSEQSGDGVEKSLVKDELSSDEFRRTVEAYISRQQKMLRDEEFSPMEYIGS